MSSQQSSSPEFDYTEGSYDTLGEESNTSFATAAEKVPAKNQDVSQSEINFRPDLELYLPLGCLVAQLTGGQALVPAGQWTEIDHAFIASHLVLDGLTRADLLRLHRAKWIRAKATHLAGDSSQTAIIRLHILPADVGLRHIDRQNIKDQLALERILDSINVSSEVWFGQAETPHTKFDRWATPEDSSLFYLFNTLPSPAPSPDKVANPFARTAMEELLERRVQGLQTELYPFQARIAAFMLQREASSELFLDPRVERRTGPEGLPLYYCPGNTTFLQEPGLYESSQGGILAESMGYGKTVIAMSLILATRYHLPTIPASALKGPPVRPHTGSLVQMAAATAGRFSIPWKALLSRHEMETGESFLECEKALIQNSGYYEIESEPLRRNRRTVIPPPQRFSLCSGTIIVVPRNLIHQWQSELKKHAEEGSLNVLVMDESDKRLPPSIELAAFDVVLFARKRFEAELKDGADAQGRRQSSRACRCPYIGSSRIRDCTCFQEEDAYVSPLKDLHWLRIMIDEGHSFSSPSSNAVLVAQKLVRADRRWVISGTPAKDDLLGVEINLASNDYANGGHDIRAAHEEVLAQRKGFDGEDSMKAARSLGNLATHFLQTRPWAASGAHERSDWISHMYRHEDSKRRTFSSFSLCMRQTLQQLIIKTQPADVEKDINLPPLTHRVVYLTPSYYDKLSANNFLLVLITNAVTSERTDIDYLFHPKSQKARNQLITNLRCSNFFWTGFSWDDINNAVVHGRRYGRKKSKNCSPRDREMLGRAMNLAMKYPLKSAHWTAMSATHEMGLFVKDWPQDSDTWSLSKNTEPSLYGVAQLIEAQKLVNSRASDPMKGFEQAGADAVEKAWASEIPTNPSAKNGKTELADMTMGLPSSSVHEEVKVSRLKLNNPPNKSTPKKKGKSESAGVETPEKQTTRKRARTMDNGAELPADSPLRKTRIVGTVSAKLSYLLDQVMTYYKDEKILIFYDADNAAYYLAQCLDLLNVKHEIYAKGLSNEMRSRYIVNFDQDPSIRVLLMDVRLGALGLNVNQASRVYFINPVCRPSIEAQAIKRAHRIGQKKPVHVETLVLRGTIEAKIFERSKAMTRNEHLEAKTLEDDQKITDIIQQAWPMKIDPGEDVGSSQMALLGKPQQLFGRADRVPTAAASSPRKKRQKTSQNDAKADTAQSNGSKFNIVDLQGSDTEEDQ